MSGDTSGSGVFKRFMPRSLLGRSLLILITPVLLIQIVTVFMFFDRHWIRTTIRLAYAVAGEAAVFTDMVESGLEPEELVYLAKTYRENLHFTVRFQEGAQIGEAQRVGGRDFWQLLVMRSLQRELRNRLDRPFVLDIDFQGKAIHIAIQASNGVVDMTLPGRRLFSSSGHIFLLWMIGTSMILLVIAILFMRNQIRPIRKLAIAAERFGKGRELQSFRPSGAREVRQAAQSFIDMHTRIRRQMDQRTAMLAGVSHDLRTPLTRMKLQLAMMGDSSDVTDMKGDIMAMERMIEGYLDFVRGEGDEQAVFTGLNELIDKIVEAVRRNGITVNVDVQGDLGMALKPIAMERCLVNLISNAGKYADNVWVRAWKDQDFLRILIEDDGPGIPEDQYDDVFKPFYRVDTSRNAATGGVGLGMPIAMDIVHNHGGEIVLEKSVRGGLAVHIALPM